MSQEYFTVLVMRTTPFKRKRFKKVKWDPTGPLPALFTALSESFYENEIYSSMVINGQAYPSWTSEYAMLLRSLLNLLEFIDSKTKKTFVLDFNKEGSYYVFTFTKTRQQTYLLDFEDRYDDVAGFPAKQVSGTLLDLKLALFTYYSRTIFFAGVICPEIIVHPLFSEWQLAVDNAFKKR